MRTKLPPTLGALAAGVLFLTGLLLSGSCLAATFVSSGSGGELLSNAVVVSGSGALDLITGSLTTVNGVSVGTLFEISINDPADFSASTVMTKLGTNDFDTQLFLFDASGTGIAGNDDTSTTSQSLLSSTSPALSSITAGIYYLLIEGSGRYPVDSSNRTIFPNIVGGNDPTKTYAAIAGVGTLAALSGNSSESGSYSIQLTGAAFVPAAVPEPSLLALILTGILAAFGGNRLSRREK